MRALSGYKQLLENSRNRQLEIHRVLCDGTQSHRYQERRLPPRSHLAASIQPFFASSSPSNGSQERSPPQTQHCQRPIPPAGGMAAFAFLCTKRTPSPTVPAAFRPTQGAPQLPVATVTAGGCCQPRASSSPAVPEGTRCPRIPASPGPFLRRGRTKRRLPGFDRPTRHVRPWPLGTAGSRPGAG